MKKAKIMLIAITVLATVGGTLAFKAKGAAAVYCKSSSGICGLAINDYTYQRPNLPNIPSTTDPCPAETVFYTESGCNTSFIETQNTVWDTLP